MTKTQKQPRIIEGNFGGKIANFTDNAERDLELKHLKAYLGGHEYFRHGYSYTDGVRNERWFKVQRIKQ